MNIIKSVFITLTVFFQLIPCIFGSVKSFEPEYDNPDLNVAIVSDIHCDGNYFRDRMDILRYVFAGISENKNKFDALLIAGDITNSGTGIEYRNLNRLTKTYLKVDKIIPCMGNHDTWNGSADPDYEKAEKLYIDYVNKQGFDTDKTYYSAVINGYYFINICPESICIHETTGNISAEQLNWVKNQLSEAEKIGKPVFVTCHFPLNSHNDITESDCIDGETLNSIDSLLKNFASGYNAPVFYISGHFHKLTDKSFDSEGNVYYINMPSTLYTDDGGYGIVAEGYEGKIILKLRNFITDEWIDGYEYRINYEVK